MKVRKLYVTTVDEKNHTHLYKLPVTDTVPDGHQITNVKVAETVRLSSLLSPSSLAVLKAVR